MKIDKGKEITRDVKVPGYVGTHKKSFCCDEHADKYEEETKNAPVASSGGGCCG